MSGKKITIIFCAVAALFAAGLLIWDVPRGKVEILLEKSAIEKAALTYLKAEKEGDLKQIYALLAPSSAYRQAHSYDSYLKDIANYPPVKINTYKIVDIYRLRDNDNRDNYPGVDKLVQVEVDVTFADSGEESVYNYSFTFLKEKGNWYKG
ncbi:MAG: hypothetical protein PHQ63_02695 [Smithellaceae bacterium]|nr:hypothetical protein [Smithellaceae bacterium]